MDDATGVINDAPEPLSTVIVDNRQVSRIESPQRPEQVAELLASAAGDGDAVIPFGGRTQLGLGNPPTAGDIGLSLEHLDRVLAFEPDDLTLSVEAGVTLARLQQTLGERGQWLPIEAPDPERATIGGLIATAFSGPRRLGSETIRDLLVGISVAHPTGALSKAGGTVVKNVTGFDMMRLYHGSLGTLGVIVSANFKVLPRPRAELTLFVDFATLEDAIAAARRLFALRGRPVALEIVRDANVAPWTLAVRYEGRDGTVAIMADEAASELGRPVTTRDTGESADWWQSYVDFYTSGVEKHRVLLRAASRPRDIDGLSRSLSSEMADDTPIAWRVSPGLGRIDAAFEVASLTPDRGNRLIELLRDNAEGSVLYDAPPDWKESRDVWGPDADTIDLMRALKSEFDPRRVISPGRFAGFI